MVKHIQVIRYVYPGANINRLTQVAKHRILLPYLNTTPTHVYLLAGIPDITQKINGGSHHTPYTKCIYTGNPTVTVSNIKDKLDWFGKGQNSFKSICDSPHTMHSFTMDNIQWGWIAVWLPSHVIKDYGLKETIMTFRANLLWSMLWHRFIYMHPSWISEFARRGGVMACECVCVLGWGGGGGGAGIVPDSDRLNSRSTFITYN